MRNDFIFDGRCSSDFGLKICVVGNNNDTETIMISNTDFDTFQPSNLDRNYFTGSKHSSVLTKTIQVCKVENCQISPFTNYDIETIGRWLCRDDGYHKFAFINDTNQTVEYNAKIDMNIIEIHDKVYILELIITTDSQFGYTTQRNHFILKKNETIYVIDRSSKTGEIPVELQLICKSDGDYLISQSFNGITKDIYIDNCQNGEIITITDMCVITTSLPSHDISDDFNYVFPKVYNTITNQKNEFSVNLPCELTITYKTKRKVGI